jgi:hypothetical protein
MMRSLYIESRLKNFQRGQSVRISDEKMIVMSFYAPSANRTHNCRKSDMPQLHLLM